jgi:hypothetical protein
MPQDDPIVRLARQIDASRKAERFLANEEDVAALDRNGAWQLHQICVQFVAALNRRLRDSAVELSPPTFAPEMFRESGVNLIRISDQGRELQIAFQATEQAFSTDKFLIPYILEGEIRTYNQRMLERFEIRNQSLFFCVSAGSAFWRFYDWRVPRSASLDPDLLASLMEKLF